MPVPDRVVTRALAAYESLPEHSGRFERMRAAIEAVTRQPKPVGADAEPGDLYGPGDDGD